MHEASILAITMNERLVAAVIGLVVLILGFVLSAIVGRWLLLPLRQAARKSNRPVQFMLTDFIWLFVQLQVALAAVIAYVPQELFTYYVMLIGYLSLAVIGMWWASVRYLSRAGITNVKWRAVFILFLLPAVVIVLMGTASPAVGLAAASVWWTGQHSPLEYFLDQQMLTINLICFIGGPLAALTLCWIIRRTVRRIVAESAQAALDAGELEASTEATVEQTVAKPQP